MELMRNAWLGWQNYIDHGKFAALFLLAAVYLAVRHGRRKETGQIARYGIAAAILCIFPPTAALLMCYQTRFYNYEWIWSLVPVTAVIALGGTWFVFDWKKSNKTIKNTCYNIVLAGMLAGMIALCGRLGEEAYDRQGEPAGRAEAERVLSEVAKQCGGRKVCLWAPRGILEYARALDGEMELLYGRNMWDIALNAYSYDTYGPETEQLYLWMEGIAEDGEWSQEREAGRDDGKSAADAGELDGDRQLAYALQSGADCILLQDNLTEDAAAEMERFTAANNLETIQLEGYYLLIKR